MEFTVEDISAVKKKVQITVSAEEVTAAMAAAVVTVGQDVQLNGFRKGKVPASVIRKRFQPAVEREARESLINVHINEIVGKMGVRPVSEFMVNEGSKELVDGEPFSYDMTFEIMPAFTLPNYEGLEVEERSSEPTEQMVDNVIKGLAYRFSSLEPVEGNGPAKNGQVAIIDFEFSRDGVPLPNYKSLNFEMPIGAGNALKEFEDLVKTIPVGHTGTGPLTFPDDFIASDLAGQTVDVTVTVHAIKERKAREIDEDLAKELGADDVADLRKRYTELVRDTSKLLYSSEAEQKLVDSLAKQVDFELPESILNGEVDLLVGDYIARMERRGKRVSQAPDDLKKLAQELEPAAKKRAREKVILLAIAEKENLEVTPQELARAVSEGASQAEENPQEYLLKMQRAGMLQRLQEHMLCDKAMDVVYERANVKMVPADQTVAVGKQESSSSEVSTEAGDVPAGGSE